MFASCLRRGGSALMAALFVALTPVVSANVIHVPGDAPTIQAGIDLARDGDTVLVAPGTYNEAIDFLGKTIVVESSDGADVTIIDATGLDTSVVLVNSGEGEGTELRGFTITGGTGWNPPGSLTRRGGGIYVQEASILIEHCIITDNHVPGLNDGWVHAGGGFVIFAPHTVMLRYCTIENNTGYLGGGGVVVGGFAAIRNCIFRNNGAEQGGGLNVNNFGYVAVWQCVFESNVAGHFNEIHWRLGGGAITSTTGGAVFTQCHFLNNVANVAGGGLAASDNAMVNQCTFEGNVALENGGGVQVMGRTSVQASQFIGNTALGTAEDHGGGGINAGLVISPEPATTITDSVFIGNTARSAYGGGARLAGTATVTNCTFQDNAASTGGAVHLPLSAGNTPSISGSTFIGNSATDGGGLSIAKAPGAGAAFADVSDCHFEDNVAEHGGGIAAADQTSTTCADCEFRNNAASVSGGAVATSLDAEYQSAGSFYCGSAPEHIGAFGSGGGQWTDIGGNEFLDDCPPGSIVGDLNGDGVVDVSDLLILLAAWGTCTDPGDCPADLNGDGAVDVSDLLILLSNWG